MIKRLISDKLDRFLIAAGAVLITGPKYCGKTFLASIKAKSAIYLEPNNVAYKNALSYDHSLFTNGDKPRLIDEWQDYPEIWDIIRHHIDLTNESPRKGLFILTGSTKPIYDGGVKHSGAGRIMTLHMQTLTFAEILSLNESNSISIKKLIDNDYEFKQNYFTIDNFNEMLIKGGWPDIIANNLENHLDVANSYIESICKIQSYLDYKFNIGKNVTMSILRSIARLSSSPLKFTTILNDINGSISLDTLKKYINFLYDIDFLFQIPVWNNINIRSKSKIRTTPKTYVCDTSLLCSLLKINSTNKLRSDLKTAGIIFENQVIKDLTVYANVLDAELFFYRDENGNELDAIMEFSDGSWIAIEIKLSINEAMEAFKNMERVIKTMRIEGQYSNPIIKLIISNTDCTTKLNDNTYIIPHTLLKP